MVAVQAIVPMTPIQPLPANGNGVIGTGVASPPTVVLVPPPSPVRLPTTQRERPLSLFADMPQPPPAVRSATEVSLEEREAGLNKQLGRQATIIRTMADLIRAMSLNYYGVPFALVEMESGEQELRVTAGALPPVQQMMLGGESLVGAGRLKGCDWGSLFSITVNGDGFDTISGHYGVWLNHSGACIAIKSGLPAIKTFLRELDKEGKVILFTD